MDFIRVGIKENKDGTREYFPSLQVLRSEDLVIRGGSFVAVWDEDTGLYSRDVQEAADIIDRAFSRMVSDKMRPGDTIRKMRVFDNQLFSRFLSLIRSMNDGGPELDQKIIFADQTPTKLDAATFKMSYPLHEAPCTAWDQLIDVLYSPEERIKIEWAIGSILSGDAATKIQKIYVFFGPPGTGKSTVLNIIEQIFEGHTAYFSAYEMGRGDSQFSLEPFAKNPLVAIDQDGDLSKIDTNKSLNSIVSHDKVLINAKGKNLYTIRPRATLFVGTNEPVKISDRRAGLFRRLVNIQPTGVLVDEDQYHVLMHQVRFELGAIAHRCLTVYNHYGAAYLSSYRAMDMMYRTNDIFNFVEDNRLVLARGVTLKQAHKMYLEWCNETDTKAIFKQYKFRDVLADYFDECHDQIMIDGVRYRSFYTGLKPLEKFSWLQMEPEIKSWLQLEEISSVLDAQLADCSAQLSTGDDKHPLKNSWGENSTRLSELDTREEHYVKVPEQHIVIDFDLRNSLGKKDLSLNLKAAAGWPPTYVEVSRGGQGLHLHYNYVGDVNQLAPAARDGSFEIKNLLGGASLRRKLTRCNSLAVATLSGGLPLKEEKVLSPNALMTDKGLRDLLVRALRKEIWPHTKPSMDFMKKVLDDAQEQGLVYDVSDMYEDVFAFAMGSNNQRDICLEILEQMKFASEEEIPASAATEAPIVYFDCEVYRNLFVVCWMFDEDDAEVVKMINPAPHEVEELLGYRLVGYNNRKYDNHILYAKTLGYSNEALYKLSQSMVVDNDRNAMFGAAYNLSYADIYDYAAEKKSLKKWMIELGLPHVELDIPWDSLVPEDRVLDVADYCANDVRGTREVAKARSGDFAARQILAELSGLEVCNTTRQHTEKLVFGEVKDTQADLVYTDLSVRFPGYVFDRFAPAKEKSTYNGENVGEGGYVYAEPGMYQNVALLDVASMHPTSIVELNLFGKHTETFKELIDTRLDIKNGRLEEAAKRFGGKLATYVSDPETAAQLEYALKIVINTVYGLTAASFPNKFKDDDNIDNIVAKRGALFMIDLKNFIKDMGFQVVHIKTDSVKIPNADENLILAVKDFASGYGYSFDHEATYEKFCLVNDAVYIAKYGWAKKEKKIGTWEATGAQFQHPFVFKSLFSHEELIWDDYVEVKQVMKGAMYLVWPNTEERQFVGRFGAFVPILNGRLLLRVDGDKVGAVTGTKGYLWEVADVAKSQGYDVDPAYFEALKQDAINTIEKYGSFSELVWSEA
jgi:hypothetical protein